MLSSHRFLCLPFRLPPCTVPCRIVLASPNDHVTYPYHFTLHLFTEVRRSSYGPMVFPILIFTTSLVMWSLYQILRSLRKHFISSACILLLMSAVMVHVSHAYKNMDIWTRSYNRFWMGGIRFRLKRCTCVLLQACIEKEENDSVNGKNTTIA